MQSFTQKAFFIFLFPIFANAQTVHQFTHFWNEVDFVGKFNNKLGWQLDIEYYRQSAEGSIDAVKCANHLMFRP